MKVKALVSMCLEDFTTLAQGQIIDLDTKIAKQLQEDGLVEVLVEEKKKTKSKTSKSEVKENVE